jgi:hypothetical protein
MRNRWAMDNGQWAILPMLLCFCSVSTVGISQKVSTLLSKDKIVLGEQITLQVKVEGITKGDIQQDFSFPDTVNHIEILKDSVEDINSSTILHTLTLTSFDSGYWQLPSFKLLLTDQRTLTSDSLRITVLPVDVSGMQDYHDIKDILEVQPENNWWVIASIILLGLVSLFSLLWFMNYKPVAAPEKIISPSDLQKLYTDLLKRIAELETSEVTTKAAVTSVFDEASRSTRNFIDKVYRQDTASLTTGEFMLNQKEKLSNTETGNNFFQFLRLADAVKFAKYLPPAEETKAVFPVLRNVITEVYEKTKKVS